MIQAITLLVIAALVAIDQVIKIAVVNGFSDDFYGCCYSHVHFPTHD